jgi:hypothetical protein
MLHLHTKVTQINTGNRRITISETAMEMKISAGSAQTIVAEELHYRKVCARWIPRRLTPEIKDRRWDVSSTILARYEQEGETFLKRIITEDESYVHPGIFTSLAPLARSTWTSPQMG